MKPEVFESLQIETKRMVVLRRGVLLMSRKTVSYRIYLFYFFGYYVELVTNRKDYELEWVNSFENLECLEPYLDQIDISEVIAV